MATDKPMQLGMIGLGRMGANLTRRLMRDGHHCVVYDINADAVKTLEDEGAEGSTDLATFVNMLDTPRNIWLMIPAGLVEQTLDKLKPLVTAGDTIIDGGNSYYRDDIIRSKALQADGIHYVDCGTSGGIWGLDRGYCLMIGGQDEPVARLDPIFKTIAPGVGMVPPTPSRTEDRSTAADGYLHCGPNGAGHFVKMVHNGIEYGMMAAIAEGLSIIEHADAGDHMDEVDAETTPLRDPWAYKYDIDVGEVSEVWRRGSVISSWLIDLTADAFAKSPDLSDYTGRVSDSGEGRWTVEAAIDTGVPASVISSALYERFESRGDGVFTGKVLSAMRSGFGGHQEKKAD
ncbi:MAG TPA: decarboxylating 6-phosphogluconate dehydrogenase [Streptosporangiaceae bacterium]|nr:decarboxylating 6-phosphogluconate dehydrogenase [Streptosporangiaceae bacterium]